MLRIRSRFVQLLVFHKHYGDCQVQEEERANQDAHNKVKVHEPWLVCVHVNIHDLCPPFHSNALENGEKSVEYVVEVNKAVVERLYVSIV